MLKYRTTLARWLTRAADGLLRQPRKLSGATKFVDLAPTDEADPTGVYSDALLEATSNPRVRNIALTGPYGSGKSSIIRTFLKIYRRPTLPISLAAFAPDANSTSSRVTRQEIERSILQQMLYGTAANRLPLSRFKRIQSPGRWSIFASLFLVIGLIASWQLIQERDAILKGTYFNDPVLITNWLNIIAFTIGLAFIWRIVHHVYISSFGLSLKSISLKDVEITPHAATEESILNRHLDEIVYFFQSTNFELVVIEDLDRFDDPEIFVTLREINGLINANSGVKRPVRFLYAIRDNIFANTDRTKFFEFLIPVIPIINSSNSIDKVIEQGRRLALDSRLDTQFLREVSRYLDDLRLIQNIFNEYAIYASLLETEEEANLDTNKLLAVLIYKNVFPSDFEKLHRNKGHLAEVFGSRDRYIADSEAKYAAEISHLEEAVALGDRQLPNDIDDLRRIYAMALVEAIPPHYSHIGIDRSNFIPIPTLTKSERFEEFLNADHLFAQITNGGTQRVSLSEFQANVDPRKTFQQRKADVEKKSAAFRDSAYVRIRDLRSKLADLRMMKFNEIVRENVEELNGLFSAFADKAELARFLVLEGYLDDTYYQYTSLFHKGRLSPSDNKFLIRIRGFSNPEPDFQIDNPKEVIAAMRAEDFRRHYVLNATIVDCLLSNPAEFSTQTSELLQFVESDFAACEAFFTIYYARGLEVPTLIAELARAWPGFVKAAIASPTNITHVARIISHLSDKNLKELAGQHPALSKFVSEALPDILALGIDFPPERLKVVGAEISELATMEAHPAFVGVLFNEGLYKLSVQNLDFIFNSILSLDDRTRPHEQNLTTVLESDSPPLLAKVERRFGEYLREVLLRLPDNRSESVSSIRFVIGRDDLDFDSVIEFLQGQTNLLPTLEQVPLRYQAALFQLELIEPTWENCLLFLGSESYDAETLTDFLNLDATVVGLARQPAPDGDSALSLRKFIIENDALDDEAYEAYVKALPRPFKAFPEQLSPNKTEILIANDRVSFSPENLAYLGDNVRLSVAFVSRNAAKFLEVQSACAVDDDFREKLLEADLVDEDRLQIIRAMDLTLLDGMPARAALVGTTLARTGVVVENLGVDAARAVILNARPLEAQISLFNMLHERFNDQQVREILQALPEPLPDIKPGWATPRIELSEVNLRFVAWLKDRGFISSWKQGGFFDDAIRINLFRK